MDQVVSQNCINVSSKKNTHGMSNFEHKNKMRS